MRVRLMQFAQNNDIGNALSDVSYCTMYVVPELRRRILCTRDKIMTLTFLKFDFFKKY